MEKKAVPDISVVMPVYNSGQFLGESIESILNQTFDNFEFIIIDDFSTDNSISIIKKYMKNDDRIILIENKRNYGPAFTRNRGLEIAKGRYIAIMDSDDISLPDRLEKQFLFLENNNDIFLIGSSAIMIDEKGNYLEKVKVEESMEVIKNYNPIIHTSTMFRNKNIAYREKFHYAEDYDLYLRMLTMGLKIKNINNEILVKIRIRSSSITWNSIKRGNLFTNKAQEFYNQRLERGTDKYDILDEKELLNMPSDEYPEAYFKKMIRLYIKNENVKEGKNIIREYRNKISFINRVIYTIALECPVLNNARLKIKFFIRGLSKKKK